MKFLKNILSLSLILSSFLFSEEIIETPSNPQKNPSSYRYKKIGGGTFLFSNPEVSFGAGKRIRNTHIGFDHSLGFDFLYFLPTVYWNSYLLFFPTSDFDSPMYYGIGTGIKGSFFFLMANANALIGKEFSASNHTKYFWQIEMMAPFAGISFFDGTKVIDIPDPRFSSIQFSFGKQY